MKLHLIGFSLLAIVAFSSCQKNNETSTPTAQTEENLYYKPTETYLNALYKLKDPNTVNARSSCSWVEIPANSTDALAKAVSDACTGGVIYLKKGVHTENQSVTISKSLLIIGEDGAILKFKTKIGVIDATSSLVLAPSLYFLNAPRSAVLDIDIQPLDTDGSCAIVFENSNESAVLRCKISKFESAVVVERSDRMAIMKNTIVCSSNWKTADFGVGESVVIINGKSAYISDNDISNALFGIWPCDKWSTLERNYTHGGCYLGIILCKVPKDAGAYVLPGNRLVGADFSSTATKVINNKSTDNEWGILVIDGANNAILSNNDLSKNNSYDLELAGDSNRFGFLTPFSFNNVVNAGSFPNIRIKDCGRNNTVTGGVKINTATDPCN